MTSFTFVYEIQADSTLSILCANRLNVFLLVMVALCNMADHYIFMLWFVLLLLSFFFFLA